MPSLIELVRRRSSDCDAVTGMLPAFVAGEVELGGDAAGHVATCLRCQADVVRYRRMLRTLHALREDTEDPPPGVLAGILSRLDGGGHRDGQVLGGWAVVLGLAVVAGASGAAAVLVWSNRRRSLVSGLS